MHKFSMVFLIIAISHLGVSTFSTASDDPKTSQSPEDETTKRKPSLVTPQSFGDRLVQIFGKKKAETKVLQDSKKLNTQAFQVAAPSLPKVYQPIPKAISQVVQPPAKNMPKVKAASVIPLAEVTKTTPAPRAPVPQVALPKIQKNIQKILDFNKQIRDVRVGQSTQLQRIQEQAQIHQKILGEMEAARRKTVNPKTPTKETLLVQEKLRMIHEETQRNSKLIRRMEEGPKALQAQATTEAAQPTVEDKESQGETTKTP